jgi:predicted ATPase/DNA-binding XRE family transcriptional regulator
MESTNRPVIFGEWLKIRRRSLDLTQAELAQRAGCSVHALRKIESGERRPSKQLAGLLANSLEIQPDQRTLFIKVARGELNLERLPSPFSGRAARTPDKSEPVQNISKMPEALPPLVGRDQELNALGQLLNDPQCQLLTVVGPGGIGKTRLAIEIASRQPDLFPDGIFFVPLASLKSSTYLVPAIADALDYKFQGHVEPRIQLLNHLRGRHSLIVIDNFEHLLDGVELLAEILVQSPWLKLFATSRERLLLRSEWVFEIEGLSVPPSNEIHRAEEFSAVSLFIQSARRAQTGFILSEEELPCVVHICQMVEGMPLGIELAAAWVSVLTCSEIAHEIDRGLDFLSSSMRDVPERQRSLQAAFDHSWNLLSEDEQRILTHLTVFHGGFDRKAAEQVAEAELRFLLALVSKSLVRRTENGRFDLHEVIRQFAQSHLEEDSSSDEIHNRYSNYYLTLLETCEEALKGATQREAMRELTKEIDNLRAAWKWAVKQGNYPLIMQVVPGLGRLYEIGGWLREGVEQFEPVVKALRSKQGDEQCQKLLGIVLVQQGLLFFRRGEFDEAQTRLAGSLEILRPLGDQVLLSDPLVIWGTISHLFGEFDQAVSQLDEGLACAQAAGDRWSEAYALINQGYVASLLGHYNEGYEQMMAGLAIFREIGDPQYTALSLNFLTPTLIHLERYEQADAGLHESIRLCEKVGDRWGSGSAHRFLGLLKLTMGEISEAQTLFHKSLEFFVDFTTGWDIVLSLEYLGDAALAVGDFSEANRYYREALPLGIEAKAIPLVMDILLGLSHLGVQDGMFERAIRLASFVSRNPSSTQDTKQRAQQLIATSGSQLTTHQRKSILGWLEGQTPGKIMAEIESL